MSQPDNKTLYFYEDLTNNGLLTMVNCSKRTHVNSVTTATISINVNLQQSIKIAKKVKYLSKDKKRPFTFKIRHDLIFVRFEAYFFFLRKSDDPLCISLNPDLAFRLSS